MSSHSIHINIHTDENHIPNNIMWEAPQIMEKGTCKSIALAMWDAKENNTLRIDVWTKDMTTDEMKKFFLQNLITLCDTYERATSDTVMANKIKELIINIAKEEKVLL